MSAKINTPTLNSARPTRSSDASHRVRSGETLSRIAKENGLSLSSLLAANPQIKDPDRIRVGQEILIPTPTETAASRSTRPQARPFATTETNTATSVEASSTRQLRQDRDSALATKPKAKPQLNTGGLPAKNGTLGLLQAKKDLLQGLGDDVSSQAKTGATTVKSFNALPKVSSDLVSGLGDLGPKNIKGVDSLQLLSGVQDGDLQVNIPLKEGEYKINGLKVGVPKGAVLKVQAQVRDGKLVPARDTRGRDTGGGCKVEIDPPIDLPLWIDGDGAYLQDKGQARAKFSADLGGWFDKSIADNMSTDLRSLVAGIGDGSAVPQKTNTENTDDKALLPKGLLKLGDMKFEVGQVRMREGRIDLGQARLDLASGNKLNIRGDARGTELSGTVKLKGAALQQNGSTLVMGSGSATISARMDKDPNGGLRLRSTLSKVNAQIKGFDKRVQHPDGRVDHVALGSSSLHNSRIDIRSHVDISAKTGLPELNDNQVSGHFEVNGQLKSLQIEVPDKKQGATITLGASPLQGTLDFSAAGTRVNARLKQADLNVTGLQSEHQGSQLDLHHAKLQGDASVQIDGPGKNFKVDVDAKQIDLQVDDFRGGNAQTLVDLGRSQLTGTGQVSLGNKQGLQIDGVLQLKGQFDDLQVKQGSSQTLDLASGSTIDATVQHFSAGGNRGFELDGKANVDLGLENFSTQMPGFDATGQARLTGNAKLHMSKGEFFMTEADATVRVRVDDAKIAPDGKDFNLDVAAGSNLALNVTEFKRGTSSTDNSLKLGQGSQLNAVLDGGELKVGDDSITLQNGSTAVFRLDGLSQGAKQIPELRGRLSLDAQLSPELATKLQDQNKVQLKSLDKANARVRIDVDDVRMSQDGRFALQGLGVQLNAQADRISAVVPKPNGASADTSHLAKDIGTIPPLPPVKPSAAIQSPAGSLSVDDVQKMSASSIAGANLLGQDFHPADIAKGIKNGQLKLSIPVAGTLGKGWLGSADFAPGSKLDLQLEVRDGKIVPDQTKASFSHSGDGPMWVTVKGAYFDKDNNLRMDLGGMRDFVVPGMEKLPKDVDKLVDRLSGRGETSKTNTDGASPDNSLQALKFAQTRIELSKAEFKPGTLQLPGGQISLKDGAQLSVSGSTKDLKVSGNVEFTALQMASDGVAIKSGPGSAKLKLQYQDKDGQARLRSTLSDVNLDLKYAVHKRANGDYIHLADGAVQGASFSSQSQLSLNAQGLPTGVNKLQVDLDIPNFNGRIESARVTVDDADGEAQIELGRSQVKGEIHVVNNKISMRGSIDKLDAAVHDLSTGDQGASADIADARLRGHGDISYEQGKGLTLDATVQNADVRLRDAKVDGKGMQLDVGRARIAGQGQVHINSAGDIDLQGALHLDATLDASTVQGSKLGAQGELKLAQDSQIRADVQRFHIGRDGSFSVQGQGGVDLEVQNIKGALPNLDAKGRAQIRGGGDFSLDSNTGMRLPDRLSIGVELSDGHLSSPDGLFNLDLAKGTLLQAEVGDAKLAGKDTELLLGPGSRLSGALDGGSIKVPGIEKPLQLSADSKIDLSIERLHSVGRDIKEAEGSLYLDALIGQDQLDLSQLSQIKGLQIEQARDGQVRLRVKVGKARLDAEGHLQLLDNELDVNAQLGNLSGRFNND